jgi:phosphatidate phosphatase LPIN
MKLGDGGEAFFVFETTDDVPAALQTSPLVSPASSPASTSVAELPSLQEPPDLDLDCISMSKSEIKDVEAGPISSNRRSLSHDLGMDRSTDHLSRYWHSNGEQAQSHLYRSRQMTLPCTE